MEISEEFMPNYEKPETEDYKNFVEYFENQMEPYYNKTILFFAKVTVIKLSPGTTFTNRRGIRSLPAKEEKQSVKVQHDVVLDMPNNDNNEDEYTSAFNKVEVALEALKNDPASLNIGIINFTASETQLNDDVCKRVIELLPEEYREYYAKSEVPGKVACVNQCHRGHPNPKRCSRDGTCEVSSQGPSCYCRHTDVTWYLGGDCSYKVNKVGFYAGLGVVAVIAVITVALLTVYLVINQKKAKRSKDIKKELVKEWLEDDFEWPQQKKTYSGGRAPHDNPVYSQRDFNRRDSMGMDRQDFSAGRSYTQYSTPEPGINLQNFHRNVKIDRPQIRSSFEI
ncbi:mucin-3A [Triplophysa dalaica]|uniref:mucin-3A n=1 Tax=Triplophysa dalaica TaxID=1582913 RepID=UPI0024DFA447|nr:mucin-3A [Triplophysa dalaica]